jgi:hypothetical protein
LWASEEGQVTAPALTLDQLSQLMAAVGATHLIISPEDILSRYKLQRPPSKEAYEPTLLTTSTSSLHLLVQQLQQMDKEGHRFQPDATGIAKLVATLRERHVALHSNAQELCDYLNGPECKLLPRRVSVTVPMAVQVFIDTGTLVMDSLQSLNSEGEHFETIEDLTSVLLAMIVQQDVRAEDVAAVLAYLLSDQGALLLDAETVTEQMAYRIFDALDRISPITPLVMLEVLAQGGQPFDSFEELFAAAVELHEKVIGLAQRQRKDLLGYLAESSLFKHAKGAKGQAIVTRVELDRMIAAGGNTVQGSLDQLREFEGKRFSTTEKLLVALEGPRG